MSRDLCPKCHSHTALGDNKCFKCGYIVRRFTSYGFKDNFGLHNDIKLQMPEEILFNPNQFHTDALDWLAKAHIYNQTIVRQGIGYTPIDHKVFIPAYDALDKLQFYQLRALDPKVFDKCKYLTYGKSSEFLIHYRDHSSSQKVVIVEDHLSAIRLRDYSNAIALSGTSLQNNNVQSILETYNHIIFWLDSDRPGKEALNKLYKQMKYFENKLTIKRMFKGVDCHNPMYNYVNYDIIKEDPKCFLGCQIVNILHNEVLSCEKL